MSNTRVALVTGASSGIGEETARLLHEAGFTTYAVARRVDRMAALADAGVHTFAMDVTDDASMVAGINRIVVDQGRIDVLVNNAGYGSYGAVEDVPIDEARRQFEVNVFGLARLTQLVTPTMREQGAGRIINVSSIAGLHVSVNGPHYVGYAASKAGLMGLTRELAGTWGRQGIRVNAIAPGFFPSRLTEAVLPKAEASLKANCPIPRAGIEGELKGVAVFLASDASNYITGQVIVVDGGRTIA